MNLLNRLKAAVAIERSAHTAVLRLLIEAEDTKLYAEMAYPSLIEFCIRELDYSESAAYRRVQSARLLRTNPEVAEKIEDGSLSLTNAAQVQQVIRAAAKQKVGLPAEELILRVSNSTTREAEKKIAEVAGEFGFQMITPEEEVMIELRNRIRAYFSHRNANPSPNELFQLMAKEILGDEGDIEARVKNPYGRWVPVKLRKAIFARDGHRCTLTADGKRCEGTHFLQVDHIVAFAHGGKTEAENLRTLCQAHNLLEAEGGGLSRGNTGTASMPGVASR